jgi:hypothetical protein
MLDDCVDVLMTLCWCVGMSIHDVLMVDVLIWCRRCVDVSCLDYCVGVEDVLLLMTVLMSWRVDVLIKRFFWLDHSVHFRFHREWKQCWVAESEFIPLMTSILLRCKQIRSQSLTVWTLSEFMCLWVCVSVCMCVSVWICVYGRACVFLCLCFSLCVCGLMIVLMCW